MTFQTKIVCSSVALLALAACGGSSGGGGVVIGAEEEALRVFADADGDGDPDQDIADVLVNGDQISGLTVLTARKVGTSSWRESYEDEGTYTSTDSTFALEGDGDDLLVTFGPEGETPTTYRIVNAADIEDGFVTVDGDGFYFDLFLGSNLSIGDLLDDSMGSGYALRVGMYYQESPNEFGDEYRAILGAETRESMLDAMATAMDELTYNGFGSLDIRQADAGFNTYNGNLRGPTTLTADFGAGTFGGVWEELEYRERTDRVDGDWTTDTTENLAGTIMLDTSTFSVNGFAGSMTPDADLIADSELSAGIGAALTYSGAFYGDAAQEVAGSFAGAGSVDGTDYLAIGTWDGAAID